MTKRAYAIVTVPRKTDYIHETLKSLETSGFFERPENLPLHLFVGCPDDRHLASYFKDPRFEIHRLTPEEEAVWSRIEIKPRGAFGHYVAMKRMMMDHPWDEILILEDDVIAARGWLEHLEKILPEVRKAGPRWILSLYYFVDDTIKNDFETGKRVKSVAWDLFWGLQANLYPREIVGELYPDLFDRCIQRNPPDMNGDGIVCHFANEKKLPLFTSVPSLMEHIGREGTGLTPYYHWARLFLDPVVDPSTTP